MAFMRGDLVREYADLQGGAEIKYFCRPTWKLASDWDLQNPKDKLCGKHMFMIFTRFVQQDDIHILTPLKVKLKAKVGL